MVFGILLGPRTCVPALYVIFSALNKTIVEFAHRIEAAYVFQLTDLGIEESNNKTTVAVT